MKVTLVNVSFLHGLDSLRLCAHKLSSSFHTTCGGGGEEEKQKVGVEKKENRNYTNLF